MQKIISFSINGDVGENYNGGYNGGYLSQQMGILSL